MKAVIMAGGFGTRLQPLTRHMPKPMLPLLDRPTLAYIVDWLTSHHIADLMVTTCYLPDVIEKYFRNGENFGARMHYSFEADPLGTAGGIKAVEKFLDETFVVMSGDGMTDFDLTTAIAHHRKTGALATILLVSMDCPQGYGVAQVNSQGRIEKFIEKPQTWQQGERYLINTGIYILEPEVLNLIPAGVSCDFGRDVFPMLLALKIPLHAYEAKGYWSDIGTLRQYYQTQLDMLSGQVHVTLPSEVKVLAMS
ncbi:MAG: nucleotidyltransferase family protein [Acidibacillus sp.]|uniref:UTP--glucose-1-phosphate uridylyltransferase n=1 Tax=Sulfoacidibacillus ferrooxidans TaxID=2005001 RepID=A0A9X1V9M3_9BACL|nr:nucleotidyltransferase family protein [Sulfoacidibacillus ferrooxidans]MCI0183765.1 UTP--glucose-1-phosphate uridylyltransferase [Sulfoacidibacillus ferrooxidans]MCY0892198.1 nucleotidyltransferase family protein [Acidibacillus sp.]